MLPIVLPSTPPGIALTAVQLLGAVGGLSAGDTPYGRFFEPKDSVGIPSRLGMTYIYGPAFLVGAASVSANLLHVPAMAPVGNGRELLVSLMIALHFAKRLTEVWYLHVYSGDMDRSNAFGIGVYYAIMSFMVIYQQAHVASSFYDLGSLIFAIGLYVVGEAGNLFHHVLLAQMRESKSSTSAPYVIPSGGLFEYFVSPHYFCEVIAWFAIAVATGQANAYLLALSMGCYLTSRASKTKEWYIEKFDDFPKDRWCMLPFIF